MLGKKIVECSHEISESTPTWPGTQGFIRCPGTTVAAHGYFTESYNLEGKVGTHIDSPGHFIANARLIHELTPEELVSPGVVIDLTEKCAQNPDYELSVQDLLDFEASFGPIPKGALVCMRTGWGDKIGDAKAYLNFDETQPHPFYAGGTMHFPGFSKESAQFLCEQRDIHGIGIDTLSLDPGMSRTFDVHVVILGNNKYQVENMLLSGLPCSGFEIAALPLRVKNAPEMMCRVLAFINH